MVKASFERNKPHYGRMAPPSAGIVSLTVTVTAGVLNTVLMTFTNEEDSDYFAACYFTKSFFAGTMKPAKSKFRLMQSSNIPSTPFAIETKTTYQNRFGIPAAGDKIFARVSIIDSIAGNEFNVGTVSTIVLEV